MKMKLFLRSDERNSIRDSLDQQSRGRKNLCLPIFEMSRGTWNFSTWPTMKQENGREGNLEGHPVGASFMSEQTKCHQTLG